MAFLTKSEVRQAAQGRLQKSFSSSASQVLREAVRASSTEEKFDVFLSHSSEDSEIVLGVREILVGLGLTVYIDWIDDPQLDRGSVTAENADMLRRRMRASKSLIFLTTKNSVTSRWMPWELGYFDGHKTGFIGVLPIVDYSGGTFSGQVYLWSKCCHLLMAEPGSVSSSVPGKAIDSWMILPTGRRRYVRSVAKKLSGFSK